MSESIVKDIMTEFVQTVSGGSTVLEASQIMSKIGIGSIVVVQKGYPVGILTERDIVTKVASKDCSPSKVIVEDIMSQPIITVDPEKIIDEAALLMSIYNIRRLIVVGKDGRLVGIVTVADIASWLSRNENYKNNVLNAVARLRNIEQSVPYG